MIADKMLLLNEDRGVTIPRCFVRLVSREQVTNGIEYYDTLAKICETADDYEDAWHDVLMNVIVRDDDGHRYCLIQDGDVWAVPHPDDVEFVIDADEISDRVLHDMFDDFIDETSEKITILGMHYQPSRVLKEIDYIAYRRCFADWLDDEIRCYTFVEINNKIYPGDTKIPDNVSEYFDDPESYDGHYEWRNI